MTRAFEADLDRSVEIQREVWKRRPVTHRIGDLLARCLSPVL
jgi:hypothetical protein